jgi:hypothetical protein
MWIMRWTSIKRTVHHISDHRRSSYIFLRQNTTYFGNILGSVLWENWWLCSFECRKKSNAEFFPICLVFLFVRSKMYSHQSAYRTEPKINRRGMVRIFCSGAREYEY